MQIIEQHPESIQYGLDALILPPTMTQEEWLTAHRHILTCRKAAGKWLRISRDYATGKWGLQWTAEAEAQMELNLGIAADDAKPTLNAKDKSTVFVTIEGISQKFSMWNRKVEKDIPSWDKGRLSRALELLAPIERKAAELRQLLGSAE